MTEASETYTCKFVLSRQPGAPTIGEASQLWAVTVGYYEEVELKGLFSSEEGARFFLSRIVADGAEIKPFVIDEGLAEVADKPTISAEYHPVRIYFDKPRVHSSDYTAWRSKTDIVWIGGEDDYSFFVFVRADTYTAEQAQAIADEKLAQYQRIKAEQPDLTKRQILNRLK